MFELDLPLHRQARAWVDNTPPASFEADETFAHISPAGKPGFPEVRRVAVELLIPKGARVLYGLLGAEYRPSESGELHVLINSLSAGPPLEDPLLSPALDEVQIGLPAAYMDSVIEGVMLANEGDLPAGMLKFQYAAHGIVSSCQAIFRALSLTVVRLLATNQLPTKEQDILPFLAIDI